MACTSCGRCSARCCSPTGSRSPTREGEADEVVCAAVDGPNLVGVALEALRARGWRRPPLRVEIEKRIPVAAGLGGGSADAAAVLRLAVGEVDGLAELAAGLGADVPSQLEPEFALVGGAGEAVERLAVPGEFGVVLIAAERGADRGGGVCRGGLARPRPLRGGAGAARRRAARGGRRRARRRSSTRSSASTTSSRRRSRCGPRSPRRWRRSTRSAPRGRWCAARARPRSGLFADLAAADAAASALPPRYAGAIVSAPQRLG